MIDHLCNVQSICVYLVLQSVWHQCFCFQNTPHSEAPKAMHVLTTQHIQGKSISWILLCAFFSVVSQVWI
jgi:hypothetical protein